jgi:hypothetical protein
METIGANYERVNHARTNQAYGNGVQENRSRERMVVPRRDLRCPQLTTFTFLDFIKHITPRGPDDSNNHALGITMGDTHRKDTALRV